MVGGENESLVGEMIGQAVLPLPLLKEGLGSLQIDMVRLALNLHTQGKLLYFYVVLYSISYRLLFG